MRIQPNILMPLLLVLTLSTNAVDIHLEWWSEYMSYNFNYLTTTCTSIPPSVCCTPDPSLLPALAPNRASSTRFVGLLLNQFGAGWPASTTFPHPSSISCSGIPNVRVHGPGDPPENSKIVYTPEWGEWVDNVSVQDLVHAASWVDLRTRFPPGTGEVRYLALQGVKGWVWGRGTWSEGSDGVPFPKSRRGLGRRDGGGGEGGQRGVRLNGFAERGVFNVTAPRRWVYGDVVGVNGTEYRRDWEGVFVDREGRKLDLSVIRRVGGWM